MMHRCLLVLLVVTSSVSAFAAPLIAPNHFQINDRGQQRQFEVALDEVVLINAAKEISIQSIQSQATVEAVRQTATALQGSNNEVELVLYEVGKPHNDFSRRVLTKQVLAELAPGTDAQALAQTVGASGVSPAPILEGFFMFDTSATGGALALAEALQKQPGVVSAEPQLAKRQRAKLVPNDTLFTQQWHLRNTGQGGGTAGVDINVTNVWNTYQGNGINLAIVDDGLQYTHPDLTNNYVSALSTNITGGNADPAPNIAVDDHGTACAGVAAARGTNGAGVTGAAFRAGLVGIRLNGNFTVTSDAQEATAMSHRNDIIDIKSNSWGPDDDGATVEGPGTLTAAALAQAVKTGRGGKGTIFTWAAGNGLQEFDNANYDGYANSIYTIAVTAISDQGNQSDYAEPGACIVVAAPSDSQSRQGITTTDLTGDSGYNFAGAGGEVPDRNYTQTFGGTSSATPLAAGVVALMLNANTNLGWRDVQEILLRSATKNNAADSDWTTNAAGFQFNHKYGAGLINAGAAVALASGWVNLGGHSNIFFATNLTAAIPNNNTNGINRTFVVSSNVNLRVEHVTVTFSATHTYRGDIAITLTSPSGTKSRLTELHNDNNANYSNWKVMTVRNWGELAAGTWTINIADHYPVLDSGTLTSLRLDIFGARGPLPAGTADLAVTAGAAPNPVVAGDNLTCTLTVRNNGPTNATSITLTNPLPAGAKFVSAVASQGTASLIGNDVICNVGALASNGTATVTLTVIPTLSGTITNVAGAYGSPVDADPDNTVAATVTTVLPQIINVASQPRPTASIVTWNTRTQAICRVEYGLTTSYGFSSGHTASGTNHSTLLVGLQPGTNYFYRVVARIGTNEFAEGPFSFSTDFDLIVDNPQAGYSGTWTLGTSAPDKYGTYYQSAATTVNPAATAVATYAPNITLPAKYDVSIWHPAAANRTTNAQITVFHNTGANSVSVNQTINGGTWLPLGTALEFAAGTGGFVTIANNTGEAGKVVMADAVRWSYTPSQDNTPVGTVPPWWSTYYFGGSVNATQDPDGDKFSTYAEYVIGTDPTNSSSGLQFRAQHSPSGAQITFSPYLNGRVYQLLSATNLTSGPWSVLTNTPTLGAGEGIFLITNPTVPPAKYYRLSVKLAP